MSVSVVDDHMDRRTYDTALRVWVVASLVVGIGFIMVSNPVVTAVGVLLVIFGLLGLMPVVKHSLTAEKSA